MSNKEWNKNNKDKIRGYNKKYREKNRDKFLEYYRNWYKNRNKKRKIVPHDLRWDVLNVDKRRVNKKVLYEVKMGRIIKPSKCQTCGRETKLMAYHKDYKKIYEVNWLCGSCHRLVHFGRIKL